LIKKGAKGGDPNTLALEQFAMAVRLIPPGKDMRYDTHSDWLVEQCCVGLDRDACMPQWEDILKYIDEGPRRVHMVKIDEGTTDSIALEAAQLYAIEAIPGVEEDLAQMVDGYRQSEAQWS
jgi:hypothetical protein